MVKLRDRGVKLRTRGGFFQPHRGCIFVDNGHHIDNAPEHVAHKINAVDTGAILQEIIRRDLIEWIFNDLIKKMHPV